MLSAPVLFGVLRIKIVFLQSLVRPPLHGSSFMPQSKHAESDAESSVTASSQGSRKGLSRLSEKIFRTKQKFTAAEVSHKTSGS